MKCYSLTFRQIAMKMCAYTWNQYRMHVLEVLNVNFSLFSRCLKEKKIVWGRCMDLQNVRLSFKRSLPLLFKA